MSRDNDMNRRGILGTMVGAAVAGPSMVKEAAAGIAQGMGGLGGMVGGISSGTPAWDVANGIMPEAYDPAAIVASLRKNLADLLSHKGRAEFIASRLRDAAHMPLSPDLVGLKSISVMAKVRMQAEREYDRMVNSEKGWLERRIDAVLRGDDGKEYVDNYTTAGTKLSRYNG